MTVLLTVGVYVLAVARVVRLVNHDTILDPVRVWVAARGRDDNRSAAERARWNVLLHWAGCPWCVSVWVAAGSAWIPLWCPDSVVAAYVGVVLAVSMLVGVASPLSADEVIDFEPADG